MDHQEREQRIDYLKKLIASRSDMKGRPLYGYSKSVEMARQELDKLEAEKAENNG